MNAARDAQPLAQPGSTTVIPPVPARTSHAELDDQAAVAHHALTSARQAVVDRSAAGDVQYNQAGQQLATAQLDLDAVRETDHSGTKLLDASSRWSEAKAVVAGIVDAAVMASPEF